MRNARPGMIVECDKLQGQWRVMRDGKEADGIHLNLQSTKDHLNTTWVHEHYCNPIKKAVK